MSGGNISTSAERLIDDTSLDRYFYLGYARTGHIDRALSEIKAAPENLAHLVKLIDQGQISNTMAKTVFDESFLTGESPAEISSRLGLVQISDKNSLNLVVEEVLQENPKTIQDYLDGKNSALRFLVGQIMKKTKGNANPKMASEILETTLGTRR